MRPTICGKENPKIDDVKYESEGFLTSLDVAGLYSFCMVAYNKSKFMAG